MLLLPALCKRRVWRVLHPPIPPGTHELKNSQHATFQPTPQREDDNDKGRDRGREAEDEEKRLVKKAKAFLKKVGG